MPVVALSNYPDLLSLHAANPRRYPFLLQTTGGKGWDILFAFPQSAYLHSEDSPQPFLEVVNDAWQESRTNACNNPTTPFRGGWFVFTGYELLHEIEPSVLRREGKNRFPLAALYRIPAAIMCNRTNGEARLFAEDEYAECIVAMQDDLHCPLSPTVPDVTVRDLAEEHPQIFLDGVGRIQRYIREGDVFQVNLARRWSGVLGSGNAQALYSRLCISNPAPFAGLADFGDFQIVSSSPERLVKVSARRVETRPIAGTHPRSLSEDEDARLRAALAASPKEQAEHVMLIDLERNDLGRICAPGSVRVEELMAVESYAHVHHIESTVSGTLKAGIAPQEVLRALFPGGTITGCPKVRTMQIISELEASPRAAYTGSMGYLNRDGDMDMNILIRTFMLDGNQLSFKAGAGIVADSIAQRELAETRAKAKGLLKALGQ